MTQYQQPSRDELEQTAIALHGLRHPELERMEDWNKPVSTAERDFRAMPAAEQQRLIGEVKAAHEIIALFGLVTRDEASRLCQFDPRHLGYTGHGA